MTWVQLWKIFSIRRNGSDSGPDKKQARAKIKELAETLFPVLEAPSRTLMVEASQAFNFFIVSIPYVCVKYDNP
jgi:hypothetical protein